MSTSARLLRLLSLLQRNRHWPGPELATRLEVSERTLRRDVDRLRSLGYPVSSSRGTDGGYELEAGQALPPLLLDDQEAVALAAGLHRAAHDSDAELAEASISALAKLVAMLPPALRQRVEVVGAVTVAGRWGDGSATQSTPSPEILGRVAQACRDAVRLRFDYTAADGTPSSRYVEPYRMVTLSSRWYIVAFDIDRDDWRTFRVDRVTAPEAARNNFTPRPLPHEDLAEFVRAGIASLRPSQRVVVDVHDTVEHVHAMLGPRADVTAGPDDATARLTMHTDSLDWPILALSMLDADFTVIEPPELVDRLRTCAERFARSGFGQAST